MNFLIWLTSIRTTHRNPLHRMFCPTSVLLPISVQKYTYSPNNIHFAYLYVFGVRLARWNCS